MELCGTVTQRQHQNCSLLKDNWSSGMWQKYRSSRFLLLIYCPVLTKEE